jgi:hypothetical protein
MSQSDNRWPETPGLQAAAAQVIRAIGSSRMTKPDFLAEYEAALRASGYGWAADDEKVARFMDKVRITITTDSAPWDFHGSATKTAWRNIGGKGMPTRKQLRELAD